MSRLPICRSSNCRHFPRFGGGGGGGGGVCIDNLIHRFISGILSMRHQMKSIKSFNNKRLWERKLTDEGEVESQLHIDWCVSRRYRELMWLKPSPFHFPWFNLTKRAAKWPEFWFLDSGFGQEQSYKSQVYRPLLGRHHDYITPLARGKTKTGGS